MAGTIYRYREELTIAVTVLVMKKITRIRLNRDIAIVPIPMIIIVLIAEYWNRRSVIDMGMGWDITVLIGLPMDEIELTNEMEDYLEYWNELDKFGLAYINGGEDSCEGEYIGYSLITRYMRSDSPINMDIE